jgi:HSP20 family protein
MALNTRQTHSYFPTGFDELFAPMAPFAPPRREPIFDIMTVFPDFKRSSADGGGAVLLHSSPGYEINETENNYRISVDVPGVKADDMTVNIEHEGKVLHISGGRKVVMENKASETRFEKRFTIGDNVNVREMTANLADGVLILSAPKMEKEEKQVFNIAITEGPRDGEKKEA